MRSKRGVRVMPVQTNLIVVVIVIGVGLGVHAGIPGILGDFLGDALFAVLIAVGIFLIMPRLGLWGGTIAALVICWTIELAQLSGVPAAWSQRWPVLRFVFGTTFSALDLVAYGVGIVLLVVIMCGVRMWLLPGSSPRGTNDDD